MDYEYLANSLASLAGVAVRTYVNGKFQKLYHHMKFSPDFAITEEQNIFKNQGDVSYYMDENFLFYGLFRVRAADVALVMGPVAQSAVNREHAARILRHMGEPINRTEELVNYFASVPAYPLRNFLQILCTIQYFINGEKQEVSSLIIGGEPLLELSPGVLYSSEQKAPERFQHNTMELEEHMLSCVEHGKVDEIREIFKRPVEGRAGVMAHSALRQEKNLIVCTATLVSRAAIRGGLDPETAFSLSDNFIQKAELLNALEDLARLNVQMLLEFTRRVEAAKCGGNGSALIRSARHYLLAHMGENISTEDLSRVLGMNRTYLCKRFQEETGQTVGHYMTSMKMEEAKRLLAVTKKSAAEIALYLGYSSQSYFVKVFKRQFGITPGEYRGRVR
ncbi:MAG: helix-turn-helix domain-containing protein [Lachnospiraceae bacterium]|nr:helix-turn-helix domain-containing protein [Lachnospiraceae bacterium]